MEITMEDDGRYNATMYLWNDKEKIVIMRRICQETKSMYLWDMTKV